MSTDEYTTVRLPKELMAEIDNIIIHGIRGYKSRAEFIKEAIREKLMTLPQMPELPPVEHFNLSENGVRILDRTLTNGASRGRIVDVYFRPEGIWCESCQARGCRHIRFALTVPAIQEVIREKRLEGWKLPQIE